VGAGVVVRLAGVGGWANLLVEQVSEFGDLLLQSGDLGLQGADHFGQGKEGGGQEWQSSRSRDRWLWWEGSQVAMMQASQQIEVLPAQPFFAAIVGMVLQGELSIGQPAVQGFGVDAQVTRRVGQRNKGHRTTPFMRWVEQEEHSREFSQETCRKASQENSREGERALQPHFINWAVAFIRREKTSRYSSHSCDMLKV
jgi:hypothetical protein